MAGAALGTAYRHLRHLFAAGSALGLEDGQLLARYSRSNDPAAFEALVGRHGPMVLATCRAVLRNEHDVEDAFQATFLVLAKKAGSIKGAEGLGGWLHRVAYRASVQAGLEARKRRLKEAEAAMARVEASRPESELAARLHEEIDRLPEAQRLPVVLCDLEGLSYEQAAERLGWTLPRVRHRLADGRRRLKDRLAGRGDFPLTVHAAVPPALVRSAVASASGSAAPASVVLLSDILLRGMLMTRIKLIVAASLASLALASAGVFAAGAGGTERPEAGRMPSAMHEAPAEDEAPAGSFDLRGRVVGPDGQPVASARVQADLGTSDDAKQPEAVVGPDGRFSIRLPGPVGDSPMGFAGRFPRLVGSAPGLGVGWLDGASKLARAGGPVLALPTSGPPIEGRVVDLEGRPVAGVAVVPVRIWAEPSGDFAGWVAKARGGSIAVPDQGLEPVGVGRPLVGEARSGEDGRFRLGGLGLDRVVELLLSGEGLATTTVHVLPGAASEIRLKEPGAGMKAGRASVIHAGPFTLALSPGRRLEGTARDQQTGRPIGGLGLRAGVADDRYGAMVEGVEARTDDRGRYRLAGLPAAGGYRLQVSAGPGLPYTNGTFTVDDGSSKFEPARFDPALRRGVVVRGRVTDRVTGRPVRGTVFFMALAKNGKVDEYPGYRQYMGMQFARIEADGRYEIVALPGPGLLAVIDTEGRHPRASGLEGMDGYDADMNGFNTSFAPIPAAGYHLFRSTNFAEDAAETTVDLALDPGRRATVEVLDPEGRPLGGTKVVGIGEDGGRFVLDQDSPRIEVVAVDPARPRRLTVTHEARKLAGSAYLKGDEAGPIPLELMPWGTIIGRIVDDEGRPIRGVQLMGFDQIGDRRGRPETLGDLPRGPFGTALSLGDDGRFRIEGLVPGLKYSGHAVRAGRGLGDPFRDVVLAPGELRDLGDVKVKPSKP